MKLNIIGNGFDMYHGLPSSYYYWCCYMIDNNDSLYMDLTKWYNFRCYSTFHDYPDEDFDFGIENKFWSQFEENLGEVDETAIIDSYNPYLGLEIEDYEIPMDDDKIADDTRKMFIKWVSNTLDLKENYNVIKKYRSKLKKYCNMSFSNNDKFISFNYTHMLQNIYGINPLNIMYIHGECTGNEDDALIFGHRNTQRISQIEDIISDYESRSLYQSERTNELEYKCLLKFMVKLEKDVDRCMYSMNKFFSGFPEVPEQINVYGMSLGNVDFPYFQQIRNTWPHTKWMLSYYTKDDEDNIHQLMKKLSIPAHQYSIFKLDNPLSQKILQELLNNICITTYPKV